MLQTLSQGQKIADKYDSLGFVDLPEHPDIWGCISAWFGKTGTGKSALFQSCPHAFVFNLERSSVTTPTQRAMMWPGIDKQGRTIDPIRGVISLSFREILDKAAMLCDWPIDHPRRPRIVVIDTIDKLVETIKAHVALQAQKPFTAMYGPDAWDSVYYEMTSLVERFRNAGYGVALLLHLVDKTVQLEGNKGNRIFENVPLVTANCWDRYLCPDIELCGMLTKGDLREEVDVPILKNGQPLLKNGVPAKKRTIRRTEAVFITFDRTLFSNAKQRVSFNGNIVIPRKDGWQSLEKAYDDAVQRFLAGEGAVTETTETTEEAPAASEETANAS